MLAEQQLDLALREAAKRTLAERGDFSFCLDSNQIRIRDRYHSVDGNLFVLACARQLGKSRWATITAFEEAFNTPGFRILIVLPTLKLARQIVAREAGEILRYLPEGSVRFDKTEGTYRFSNGSNIMLGGADSGNAENLRGLTHDLILVDESGFLNIATCEYVLTSILAPQLITTNGRLVLCSTPPKEGANHPFVKFARQAEADDALITATIYDNPRLSKTEVDAAIKLAGGVNSVTFRREHLAELDLVDSDLRVITAWTSEKAKQLVRPISPPAYFYRTQGIDVGFSPDDFAAVLGGWDYVNARAFVQAEILLKRAGTDVIAKAIKEAEGETWPDASLLNITRASDVDKRLQEDLWTDHRIAVQITRKDDLEAQVNALNVAINAGKLVIDPKCKKLISQLHNCTWNNTRTTWTRDMGGGHFDLISALIYFYRNLNKYSNPYPSWITPPRPEEGSVSVPPPTSNVGSVLNYALGGSTSLAKRHTKIINSRVAAARRRPPGR